MAHRIDVPPMRDNASADVEHYKPVAKDMEALGFPAERVDDWQTKIVAKLGELIQRNRGLKVMLDSCVRCGQCSDKCQYYIGTGDPMNMPVARAELLRKVYRRYFTPLGRLAPALADAAEMDEEMLTKWKTYFYQCSMCRRCAVFCPYGIDTAEITWAAREAMASAGVATKYVTEVIHKAFATYNNLGIPEPALRDSLEFLERETKEETGQDVRFPLDEKGADIIVIPPSADFFAEPHVDALVGYAKVFHAAGISFTFSSVASEAGNFGLFLDYHSLKKINSRIVEAAKDLGVKKIIMGECGHAWRAANQFTATANGPLDFIKEFPKPVHICEFTLDLMKKGTFKIDKSANDDVHVTYHDPCNAARGGGIMDEPREMIRMTCNKFTEMPRNAIRENTFCCGAGAGILTDEVMDLRIAGAKPRLDALKTTPANYMATPCAICKAQFNEVLPATKAQARIGGVHDLLSKAMILGDRGV